MTVIALLQEVMKAKVTIQLNKKLNKFCRIEQNYATILSELTLYASGKISIPVVHDHNAFIPYYPLTSMSF